MSLVTPELIVHRLSDGNVRLVDLRWYLGEPGRGRLAYEAAHLPGAIHLDLDTDLSAPAGPGRHPLPDPSVLAQTLGAAGIGTDDMVVVYDDVGGWVAARLWWMLDVLGHQEVAVMDGGFQAWVDAGLPTTTNVPVPVPAHLELADHWTRVIDRDALRARLGRVALLDGRGEPRYRGEIEPVDSYPGHIPTAINAPTDGNLVAPNGRFLAPERLRERFERLTDGADEVVTSCGSGVSACHAALAMRVAGLPDPILYPGSWSDWSASGFPAALGPEPGPPPDR